jgi:hypothetical protein
MAQLTKDTPRVFELAGAPDFNDIPCSAAAIYEGSAVSVNSGYARQLNVADTTDGFAGFCEKQCDNSAGAAGDKNVRVRSRGYAKLSVATASAVTNVSDAVYASDGGTFTLASTGNIQIGKVARWISGTTCIVYFEALPLRSI